MERRRKPTRRDPFAVCRACTRVAHDFERTYPADVFELGGSPISSAAKRVSRNVRIRKFTPPSDPYVLCPKTTREHYYRNTYTRTYVIRYTPRVGTTKHAHYT